MRIATSAPTSCWSPRASTTAAPQSTSYARAVSMYTRLATAPERASSRAQCSMRPGSRSHCDLRGRRVMPLQDKVIAVLGVGPGLGREVARLCLRDGASVALGARTLDRCEQTAHELDTSGTRTIALTADIDQQPSVDAF